MSEFGDFLYNKRTSKKLTQAQVADEIGVSRNTIQNWEGGKCIPHRKYRDKISKVFGVAKETIFRMAEMGEQKEEKEIDNWPDFLFDEYTNAIVRKLHLNFEQQELFGQLRIVGAITLEKRNFEYKEIDLSKLKDIEKMGGSINTLKLVEELKFVLRHVQENFLEKQLVSNPNQEFNLCSLNKEAICDYIDEGYKTFYDEWDPDSFKENLHINIRMKRTLLLLSILEKGDIYWTDDNINNNNTPKELKELWKYNNRPREDVPEEFKKYECIRCIPLRREFYEWDEKESANREYKQCYIRITDKGKKLLEWWRGK